MQQIDLSKLSTEQCKAIAYDTIRQINFLQQQLQGIEQHIAQREQNKPVDDDKPSTLNLQP